MGPRGGWRFTTWGWRWSSSMPTSLPAGGAPLHRREAAYFPARWPELPQAEFLAPEGYEAVYRTNAITKHGEHGNALLTRWPVIGHQHEDISTTASSSAGCCM